MRLSHTVTIKIKMIDPILSLLQIEILPYSHTEFSSWFTPFSHQEWAMLLQSAANNHPDNRFDILVADPIATLVTQNSQTTVTYADGRQESYTSDPFLLLKNLQADLLPERPTHDTLPFLGGALGYFAYDLGREIEQLPTVAINELSVPDMAVGLYDWALIFDHQTKTLSLITEKNSTRRDWFFAQYKTECITQSALFSLTSPWFSNMTQDEYAQKFNSVQEYICAGDCYQINLAQRFHAEYQGDEWEAYQYLVKRNGAPFSAFLRLPELSVLSVSPERFLSCHQSHIETKPIKGTRPRHPDPITDKQYADELQNAPKDRAENLMIVDLLRNDIGRVSKPGSVKVPALFAIESFPAVHHLVSTITGTLEENYQAIDLLRASFPGGSITGAPKIRAMEIIEELEPHRRHLYCGSIGYISRCGTMDTSITIRTLTATQGRIYAWSGGGLVADSEMSSEYQETLDKLSKILPLLIDINQPEK